MKFFNVVLIAFITISPSVAVAENLTSNVIIDTYQADLNGDGTVEEIILKGIPFSDQRDYFHYIWADIEGREDKWKINYGDGYVPEIQLIDTNHDHIQEILYQNTTGQSKGGYIQKLHTLANNQLEEIHLPKLQYISANFVDQFKVNVNFSPYKKPKQIDVKKHSDMYIESGLYNENGTLNRQKSLSLNNVSYYEPVKLSNQKGYGLRSFKQVYGISHEDQLGSIETLWYFRDGSWIAVQSEWMESDR